MTQQQISTINLQHWAARINASGLTEIAIPLLDVLQVWGFVGAQAMWMLSPFVNPNLARFAEVLEQPECLQLLQQHLLDARDCLPNDNISLPGGTVE